jgi:hypothetical protein
MKKLIVLVSVLFSINCVGQNIDSVKKDTTMFIKGNGMYMTIKHTEPIKYDSPLYNQCLIDRNKRSRKNNKLFSIITGVVFTSISVWFWSGYHH